jgi:hypothetical protein
MERNSNELSNVQAAMLLFFAGRRDIPRGDRRTTGALVSRGLVARGADSGRYEITETGRRIAARLPRDHSRVPSS